MWRKAMMWKALLKDDPIPWLVESDPANPGVRYVALRELLDRPEDDLEVGDPLLTGKAIPVEGQTAPQGGGFEMKMGMRCGENPALTQRGYRY